MYRNEGGGADDADRTAFRRAEKQYKLYYDQNTKKKKQARAVDLSEVIDFRSILNSFDQTGETPPGIYKFHRDGFDRPVFCLAKRPGFYFIPGALSVDEQCCWIKESLTSFPQPPNRTNHYPFYGPLYNLFSSANKKKVLVEEEFLPKETSDNIQGTKRWKFYDEADMPSRGSCSKTVLAMVLLRKLRWSTLGLQFDWSKRNYDVSLPYNKIPERLSMTAKQLAVPAMPAAEEFKPEAAIVNYFALGDTLGGHLDDMEADWSKPIVSLSLGCKAIFLLGGKSRDDQPMAMFLRSGDAILMAGEARECFHGVPRIFTDETHSEISPFEAILSSEEDRCFLEYIRTSRININIRQVTEITHLFIYDGLEAGLSNYLFKIYV
ncbi:hypothetical protein V2J09_015488 [Rumex salicifolius]